MAVRVQGLSVVDKEQLDALGFHTTAPAVTTVIEAFGSTSLTQVGSNFFLYNIGGSGPELKYGGGAVVAGQFGGWTAIGAEQTASGYDVAWKIPGADQYTVWSTDSNGNYLSNLIPAVPGNSIALEVAGDDFQPGPQRRWHHRNSQGGNSDRWIDRLDQGRHQFLS